MPSFVLAIVLSCFFVSSHASGSWTYEGNIDTAWCHTSDGCCGETHKHQSPIDLDAKLNFWGRKPKAFTFTNYDAVPETMTVENNGHSVAVTLDGQPRTVSGGNLPGTYVFHSLHFHWGSRSDLGSEHTIRGKRFPMELHMVHYNSQYKSLTEAIGSGKADALAVLGVLYQIDKSSDHLEPLTSQLGEIQYFSQKVNLTTPFALDSLLPYDRSEFYRYMGSLTTPSCNEAVVWTVFKAPDPVTETQMEQFRKLLMTSEGEGHPHSMSDNFRPTQPINGRKVQLMVTSYY